MVKIFSPKRSSTAVEARRTITLNHGKNGGGAAPFLHPLFAGPTSSYRRLSAHAVAFTLRHHPWHFRTLCRPLFDALYSPSLSIPILPSNLFRKAIRFQACIDLVKRQRVLALC
jgi:hypothetical protein